MGDADVHTVANRAAGQGVEGEAGGLHAVDVLEVDAADGERFGPLATGRPGVEVGDDAFHHLHAPGAGSFQQFRLAQDGPDGESREEPAEDESDENGHDLPATYAVEDGPHP